jgi:hypothetical protein
MANLIGKNFLDQFDLLDAAKQKLYGIDPSSYSVSKNNTKKLVQIKTLSNSKKQIKKNWEKLVETDPLFFEFKVDVTLVNNKDIDLKVLPSNKFNKGNVSEGIFAAAIFTRFIHKDKRITESQVTSMIENISKNGTKSRNKITLDLKSPNKGIDLKDDIHIKIEMSVNEMIAFLDVNSYSSELTSFVKSSVSYANSQNVVKWAKLIYLNKRYDKIEVLSEGSSLQKIAKTDVKVKLTDNKGKLRNVDINVSLKSGDTKQFGQNRSIEYDKVSEFLNKILSIDVSKDSNLKKKYQNHIANRNIEKALMILYGRVFKNLHKIINSSNLQNKKKIFESIGKGIQYYATLGDESVKLVQINSSEARIYNFNKLPEKLSNLENLNVTFQKTSPTGGGDKLPKIFVNNGKIKLIQIRARVDEDSDIGFNNIIEKERGLSELISESVKEKSF